MSSSYKDFFEKAQTQSGIIKKMDDKSKSLAKKNFKNGVKSISKKKSHKLALTLTCIGFFLTLIGGLYTEELIHISKNIDVSIFSIAGAEVASSSSSSKLDKSSNSKDTQSSKVNDSNSSTAERKAETEDEEVELNHLARLRERKIELDKREEDLVKLEEELTQQRADLEQKLKELENVRRNISSTLEEKVQNDDQKVQDLVAFYSNMKPPQAAKILETIDEALAVRVIEKMKKKSAADIMNLLKPEKAQSLSEKYAGYRK